MDMSKSHLTSVSMCVRVNMSTYLPPRFSSEQNELPETNDTRQQPDTYQPITVTVKIQELTKRNESNIIIMR